MDAGRDTGNVRRRESRTRSGSNLIPAGKDPPTYIRSKPALPSHSTAITAMACNDNPEPSFFELGEIRPARDSDFAYFVGLAEGHGWTKKLDKNGLVAWSKDMGKSTVKMVKVREKAVEVGKTIFMTLCSCAVTVATCACFVFARVCLLLMVLRSVHSALRPLLSNNVYVKLNNQRQLHKTTSNECPGPARRMA